jgi:phosphonate transport system substrate-binding protein
MKNRRHLLAGAAALVISAPLMAIAPAQAQDWKAKYSELTFAVIPAENASGVVERYQPFMDYLSRAIGVKVNLRVANDYAAVIEGQRAGNIHIASCGSASFARARIIGVKVDAFALDVNGDGTTGYYSVFYVKADSPYKSLEDLKGKNLGLVDPNSTSGNNVPRFTLDQKGIDPETYFSKVVMTGSHENAVLALTQGTVDVAANAWNADDDSYLTRMLSKNMLKKSDGSLMKYSDFRIILKSEPILNGPLAYLSDLPADLKATIAKAFFDAAKSDKAAFDRLSDGKNMPWAPAKTEQWDKMIDLVRFVDTLRRKRS